MAVRINCPACKTPNSFDDDKRGRKVRCRKCEKPISVPAEDENALQEEPKIKVKTGSARNRRSDDEGERPTKRKKEPAKKGFPVLLVVGGLGAVLLLCLAGVGGLAALWLFSAKPIEAIAKAEKAPEPKIDDVPAAVVKKDPEIKPEPEIMADPWPPELQHVKKALVYVSVVMKDGKKFDGTGFFLAENGLVITNAHVVGMLDQDNLPMTTEVVLNPGAPNESRPRAYVLGVDRGNDLAALRVEGFNLPAPLSFEDTGKVAESIKVHIGGVPIGPVRGPTTITTTQIVRVKKDGVGSVEDIHVNAGMSVGNAGGPVFTPAGKVVGVAAGAFRDPQLHQAIPADIVRRFLDGRIGDGEFGKAVTANGKTRVPVTYRLTDPLKRISLVTVEVWTGPPGEPRPYAYKQPIALKGDGPKVTLRITKIGSMASGDISVPAPLPGQVVWVQPVILGGNFAKQWGVATTVAVPTAEYDRRPANLTAKFTNPKERTVKLNYTQVWTTFPNSTKSVATVDGNVSLLESMGPDPDGTLMRVGYGPFTVQTDTNGSKTTVPDSIITLLRQFPTTYTLEDTGRVKRWRTRKWTNEPMRDQAIDQQNLLGAAFESVLIPMPNAMKQAGDSWQVVVPVSGRSGQKSANVQLSINNTYEGFSLKDPSRKNDAVITLTGKLLALDAAVKKYEGDISGTLVFDTAGAFVSSVQLKVTSEAKSAGGTKDFYTFDIDLQRSSGNTLNIKLPPDPKGPDPVAKAKTILDKKESLTSKDPFDVLPAKKKAHFKAFQVPVQMGKTYVITLNSGAFDAFLRVVGPPNLMLFDDNSGGGTNAKLMFQAPATGQINIFAISKNGNTGAFHLTVTEQ